MAYNRAMSRIIRLILLALVLVLVALVSALTAMRIAIHGREVEVPKFVGITPGEAETALADRGLRLEVENRFYSSSIAEGRILSQFPPPGTLVRRGWRVRVALSLGPPRATVPNVIGQSSRAAEINMRRRGLEVGSVSVLYLPNVPPDQVIAMSPPPESMGSSPKVNLLLSASDQTQNLVMPNLIGKTLPETTKAIEASGFQLGKINQISNAETSIARAETIVGQFPNAGSKVRPGSRVSLDIF
jgi:beta-lactam-binding protein with PASTA domain